MRKLLLTYRSPEGEAREWRSVKALCADTFRAYAMAHGYTYYEFWPTDFDCRWTLPHQGSTLAAGPMIARCAWSKVAAILEAMDAADLILFVDSDCVAVDLERDIADEIPADRWLAMIEDDAGEGLHPNAGVIVTRSCPEAKRFWSAVWAVGGDPGKWLDNSAIMTLLGFTGSPPVRRLADTEYTPGYWPLRSEWNNFAHHGRPCRIFHAAGGRSPEWKLQVMREAIARRDF